MIKKELEDHERIYVLEEVTLLLGCVAQGLGFAPSAKKAPLYIVYPHQQFAGFPAWKKQLARVDEKPRRHLFDVEWMEIALHKDYAAHYSAVFGNQNQLKSLLQAEEKNLLFLISVGKEYHEGSQLEATVNLFISALKGYVSQVKKTESKHAAIRIVVAVADTLQAYNLEGTKEEWRARGEQWTNAARQVFKTLKEVGQDSVKIDIEFLDWTNLIATAQATYHYHEIFNQLTHVYKNPRSEEEKAFRSAVFTKGSQYQIRSQKRTQEQEDKQQAKDQSPKTLNDGQLVIGYSDPKKTANQEFQQKQALVVEGLIKNLSIDDVIQSAKMLKGLAEGESVPHGLENLNENLCVPRDDFIKKLANFFPEAPHVNQIIKPVLITTLYGMGGIGKTHLAIYYCYHPSYFYRLRIWMHVSNEKSFKQEFRHLGALLKLCDAAEKLSDACKITKFWLETNPGWLLVLDDIDEYGAIKEWLPERGGHIILTSRKSEGDKDKVNLLQVDVMTEEQAVDLLEKICGRRNERQQLLILANKLGRLPLALEQAGAYLGKYSEVSVAEYAAEYDKNPIKLMQDKELIMSHLSQNTIATTFDMSTSRILGQDNIAKRRHLVKEFLTVCAYLAPNNIPEEILNEWLNQNYAADVMNEPGLFGRLIEQVTEHSLVTQHQESKTLSIHPVMQDVLRANQTDTHKNLETIVITILKEHAKIGKDSPEKAGQYKQLLPHMQRLMQHFDQSPSRSAPFIDFLNVLAHAYYVLGDYQQQKVCLERVLNILKSLGTPDQMSLAITYGTLGAAYVNLGEHQDAKFYLKQALERRPKLYDSDPDVIEVLDNLGIVYRELEGEKNFAKAIKYHERALVAAASPKDSLQIANILDHLGIVYRRKDGEANLLQAIVYHEKALRIRKEHLGNTHPSMAKSLSHLGTAHRRLKGEANFAKAIDYHTRALAIVKQTHGKEHPEYANEIHNLGFVHLWINDNDNLEIAIKYFLITTEIYDKKLPLHPVVISNLYVLGNAHRSLRQLERACECHETALKKAEVHYGNGHLEIALIKNTLATDYRELGQLDKAIEYYTAARELRESQLTSDHVSVAETLNEMGYAYYKFGDHENIKKAIECYKQALTIQKKHLRADHPDIKQTKYNLELAQQALIRRGNVHCIFETSTLPQETQTTNDAAAQSALPPP